MRGYLLDTCVISEVTRARPAPRVLAWLADAEPSNLFLSVVTLAELEQGIGASRHADKAAQLAGWLENEVLPAFDGRVLAIDPALARRWGTLLREGRRAGTPRPLMDTLLAATVIEHGLVLATRNTADFETFSIDLTSPWQ